MATRLTEPLTCFEQFHKSDDIEEYFEWLELFLKVQRVDAKKKVPCLLSDIGPKAYAVLKNLVAPRVPAECDLRH